LSFAIESDLFFGREMLMVRFEPAWWALVPIANQPVESES
jgi:hypothetical protein